MDKALRILTTHGRGITSQREMVTSFINLLFEGSAVEHNVAKHLCDHEMGMWMFESRALAPMLAFTGHATLSNAY